MKRTRKNIVVGLMLAVMLTAGTGVSAAGEAPEQKACGTYFASQTETANGFSSVDRVQARCLRVQEWEPLASVCRVLPVASLGLRQGICAGDRDGDGICDRNQFVDQDGDGICDRSQFVDQDGDGICDRSQFVDQDGDGICDRNQFVDQDGDGICDRKNLSGQQCQGQGQGNAGKRNGTGRWGQKG